MLHVGCFTVAGPLYAWPSATAAAALLQPRLLLYSHHHGGCKASRRPRDDVRGNAAQGQQAECHCCAVREASYGDSLAVDVVAPHHATQSRPQVQHVWTKLTPAVMGTSVVQFCESLTVQRADSVMLMGLGSFGFCEWLWGWSNFAHNCGMCVDSASLAGHV